MSENEDEWDSEASYSTKCKTIKTKPSAPTFLINRSGIPINKETWDRLWTFYCRKETRLRAECEEKVRNGRSQRYPSLPILHAKDKSRPSIGEVATFLNAIRDYFYALQYNHVGTQLFDISKAAGYSRLMEKAKFMIRCSLPIKCLEAVVMSMYFTAFIPNLTRFPITFKSVSNGQAFYHIILALQFKGQFGAIGFSRRSDLMDKPLVFRDLGSLIKDYIRCYENYSHKIVKVKIGGVAPTDMCSQAKVQWYRHKFVINSKTDWATVNRIPRLLRDIYCSPSFPPDYETMISMVQINPTLSRTGPSQIRSKSRMISRRKSRDSHPIPKTKSSPGRMLSRPQFMDSGRLKLKTFQTRRKN